MDQDDPQLENHPSESPDDILKKGHTQKRMPFLFLKKPAHLLISSLRKPLPVFPSNIQPQKAVQPLLYPHNYHLPS
jgi:hypothetical protein